MDRGSHSYSLLSSQGLKALSRRLLLAVIVIMFTSSTSISVIRICFQLKLIDALGPVPPDDAGLLITWTAVSNCLERLNYVLSDVIVVWRYIVFYFYKKNTPRADKNTFSRGLSQSVDILV